MTSNQESTAESSSAVPQSQSLSKLDRKQKAKMLKRERIVEAGGKRPRPNNNNQNDVSMINNNSKKKRNNKQKSSKKIKQTQQSRFGRVMEHTPCPNKPRTSTLSIAIPGSIVSNAQTVELRTYLIGQIARCAAIYHVDEIVVFDDQLSQPLNKISRYRKNGHHNNHHRERDAERNAKSEADAQEESKSTEDGEATHEKKQRLQPSKDPHTFMANILQYCECPQYLRRHFFPMHPDLQYAGLLPPLDAPHHVRVHDQSMFRDGVVTERTAPLSSSNIASSGNESHSSSKKEGSLVDCGIRGKHILIDRVLPQGIRCTVQIGLKEYTKPGKKILEGKVVSPSAPRLHDGTYWGYTIRMANSIQAIFNEAPYKNGYDYKIGTSERGTISVDEANFHEKAMQTLKGLSSPSTNTVTKEKGALFEHAIIVFGGVAGIEECVDADESITLAGNDSKTLFDMWVNVCQYQGSRTIRTEEAVFIGLSRLRPFLFPAHNEIISKGNCGKNRNVGLQQQQVNVHFSDEEMSDEDSAEDSSKED